MFVAGQNGMMLKKFGVLNWGMAFKIASLFSCFVNTRFCIK